MVRRISLEEGPGVFSLVNGYLGLLLLGIAGIGAASDELSAGFPWYSLA